MLGRAAGIGGGKADHAFPHRHHRIGGEPPDMALPEHGAGGDVGGLGLFDRQRHRLGVDVKAETPMAVDHRRGRRFLHDGPLRAGNDMAGLDAVDIGRDRDDAVGVMAGEIGIDAADRDRAGLLIGGSGGLEQRRADPRQAVGLDDGHGVSSFDARARGGSCCCKSYCFGFMVSKQWPQGKGQKRMAGGRQIRPCVRIPHRGIGAGTDASDGQTPGGFRSASDSPPARVSVEFPTIWPPPLA